MAQGSCAAATQHNRLRFFCTAATWVRANVQQQHSIARCSEHWIKVSAQSIGQKVSDQGKHDTRLSSSEAHTRTHTHLLLDRVCAVELEHDVRLKHVLHTHAHTHTRTNTHTHKHTHTHMHTHTHLLLDCVCAVELEHDVRLKHVLHTHAHTHAHTHTCSWIVFVQSNWNTMCDSNTCFTHITLYSVSSSVNRAGAELLNTPPSAASCLHAYACYCVCVYVCVCV